MVNDPSAHFLPHAFVSPRRKSFAPAAGLDLTPCACCGFTPPSRIANESMINELPKNPQAGKLSQRCGHLAGLGPPLPARLRDRRARPRLAHCQSGPAAARKLFCVADEGVWQEMAEGSFDHFLYEAVRESVISKTRFAGCRRPLRLSLPGIRGAGCQPSWRSSPTNTMQNIFGCTWRKIRACRRIRHLATAVADHDGELMFVQSADVGGRAAAAISGTHCPSAPATYANFRSTTVSAVRIDTLIGRAEKLRRHVENDVEGAEPWFYAEAKSFFPHTKPVILMEVHHIRLMHECKSC